MKTVFLCTVFLALLIAATEASNEKDGTNASPKLRSGENAFLSRVRQTLGKQLKNKDPAGHGAVEEGAPPKDGASSEDIDYKSLESMTTDEFEEAVFPPESDPKYYDAAPKKVDVDDSEYWDYMLYTLQSEVRDLREVLEQKIMNGVNSKTLSVVSTPLPREPNTLRYDIFLSQYLILGKPLVISEMSSAIFGENVWDRAYLLSACGKNITVVVPFNTTSRTFERHLMSEVMTMDEFMDKFGHSASYSYTSDSTRYYLLDWSVVAACHALLQNLTIPEYFVQDFMQRVPDTMENVEMPFKHDFPVLLVGPKGIKTGLQIDSLASHSWHVVAQGSLRVRVFPGTQRTFLYEDRVNDAFAADPWAPDLNLHPMLSLTTPYDAVLNPGDVLVLPAGTPYAFEIVEDVVMMSVNWIDLTCLHHSVKELTRSADTVDVQTLLKVLVSSAFDTQMLADPQPMPWWRFKGLQRGNVEPERMMLRRMVPDDAVAIPSNWKTDRRIP